MNLYYYRNRWLWFTRPLIQRYASRILSTARFTRVVKRPTRALKRQGWVIPHRTVNALLGAVLLAVAPNVAITAATASTLTGISEPNQTLTAIGAGPELDFTAIYKPQFVYPVGHAPIASPYGWRVAPCAGCSSDHNGVDFHVPAGTPIHAATTGTVVFTGWEGGLGYHIVVDDGYGYVTYYAHMIDGSIPAGIVEGSHVTMGDTIGLVGCTGQCTGAHLHFGLKDEGVFVDPIPVLERYAP